MTYLYRTADWSSSNSTSCVMSFWIKLASPASTLQGIFLGWGDANNYGTMYLNNDDHIYYKEKNGGTQYEEKIDDRKFRDHNAWYHFFLQWDYTQATASNRLKIYVNNELMNWSNSGNSLPPQNYSTRLKKNDFRIGTYTHAGSSYSDWKSLMSHVHFIDDAPYNTYTPSTFGETDSTTGEWKIKTSPSISDYGPQGFFILKNDNVGTDRSGKGNNFSISGTLTKTEDNPSNNFCTLNALDMVYGNSSLSQGNNTQNQTAQSNHYAFINGTLGFNSGKWYWEMKCVSGHSDNWYGVGIASTQCTANNNWLGQNADSYAIYGYSYGGGLASTYTGGTRTNQGVSFTAGDIIGVAVDCDNMAIYFSKNGTWMSNASSVQGVPTSGSSKTGSFFTISDPATRKYNAYGGFYLPAVCYYDARTAVQSVNFGNGYFGTTAVSSAGTNASGNGIFEYDVPTGYTALSTKGLNL